MNEILHLYKKRLVKEAVIRSLICGLVAALAALAVCSVVFWFTDFKLVWIGAIAFVAVLGGATPIFYFAHFRPTDMQTAKRIDKAMGLDERMVTLLEFKDSQETLACAQRANTVSVLRNFGTSGAKRIALKVFSAALVVSLSAVAVLGLGTTTVSALAAADVLPSGADLLRGEEALPTAYTIRYTVQGEGIIFGVNSETDESGAVVYTQTVLAGEDAKAVWAIPGEKEGEEYFFAGWSDGSGDPYRADKAISEDLFLVATFLPIDGSEFEPETDMTDQFPAFCPMTMTATVSLHPAIPATTTARKRTKATVTAAATATRAAAAPIPPTRSTTARPITAGRTMKTQTLKRRANPRACPATLRGSSEIIRISSADN